MSTTASGAMDRSQIMKGAVMWQRLVGTVEVGLGTAVVLLGVIAGLVAGIVNYMTIDAIMEPAER